MPDAWDRAVLTLVNFVAALIVSWIVVYAVYGLMLLTVHGVWWTIRAVSWLIVRTGRGVTLLLVHPVWWVVRTVGRRGEARIHAAPAERIVAPVIPSAVGSRSDVLPPTKRRPTFPDVAASIREASEALFEYQWRVCWAGSEVREMASRTRSVIAQTRALIAQIDAAAAGTAEQAAGSSAAWPG